MVIIEDEFEEFDGSNQHQSNVSVEMGKFVKLLEQIEDKDFAEELKECIFEMNSQSFLFGLTFEDRHSEETIQ